MQDAVKLLRNNVRRRLTVRGAQAALARALGVEDPTISKWLSGQNNIGTDKLGAMADFFGVTVADLFAPDLPRQTETPDSPRSTSEGSTHGTDSPRLLEAAREAGRREGHRDALFSLAATIAREIERLGDEAGTARTDTAQARAVRRAHR